jgi:hypothetical protein
MIPEEDNRVLRGAGGAKDGPPAPLSSSVVTVKGPEAAAREDNEGEGLRPKSPTCHGLCSSRGAKSTEKKGPAWGPAPATVYLGELRVPWEKSTPYPHVSQRAGAMVVRIRSEFLA